LRRDGRCSPERVAALEQAALADLRSRGWAPDYLTLRRRSDLLEPSAAQLAGVEPLIVLAAARLGQPRLLDNLEL
jgi:pantoate--beta-alanine ligase